MSSFGLENIGDLSSLLNEGEAASSGKPLRIPLVQIKEDPDQPRKFFDDEKIQELAKSILERGVKTPISLHPDDNEPGTYIINHGARRYRASLLAGLIDVPAYIDTDYGLLDQAVENIQRDNLTPREVADVVGRLLSNGLKKNEIATKMGKSNSFVSQHSALLDLPDPLADVFNSGRVVDVTVINDLNTLFKKHPNEVNDLLQSDEEITRTAVRNLKDFLKSDGGHFDDETETTKDENSADNKNGREKEKIEDPNKLKKAIVQIMYQGQLARLILNKRAHNADEVWIKFEESGETESVPCAEISNIVAIIEG